MFHIRDLKRIRVTFVIAALCAFFFVFASPSSLAVFEYPDAPLIEALLLPVRFIYASFLHTDMLHLGLNLLVWILLGIEVEPQTGSRRFLGLYVLAVLMGGAVEGLFFGLAFAGLSAACFALLSWIIWTSLARGKDMKSAAIAIAIIAGVLVTETFIAEIVRPGSTAYGAHVGGSVAGLFASLGLGGQRTRDGMTFRPMKHIDVGAVLDIIFEFDEDDGEEAEDSFARGLEHKYVIEIEGRVAAMSGFTPEDQAQGVAWLSWTYVHPDYQRHGVAFYMMTELREVLEKGGYRKVFIATSDYKDEDTGEDVYGPARKFYERKLNARREIVVKDYYDVGESKYVYSLPVIHTLAWPEGALLREMLADGLDPERRFAAIDIVRQGPGVDSAFVVAEDFGDLTLRVAAGSATTADYPIVFADEMTTG